MKNTFTMVALLTGLMGAGCATTSAQEQRQAEQHQRNSDDAARNGQFGIAGDEQRQAQESQNKAVMKSLDEGKAVTRVPDAPATAAQAR
jgi:glucose/arabinose dehydrogenase